MTEFLKNFKKFIEMPDELKVVLLKALGFEIDDEGYIINSESRKKVICKYSDQPVLFENASILPGSTIIINTNPITLAEYIGEYLEPEESIESAR